MGFFFCFRRRYLVNLSSLSPFKGGGFIVSWDAEVRSHHAGGVDCDNSHCSWDQQEVSAWDLLLQIVYLWRAKRCVFVCVFVLGVMRMSRWRLRVWWSGWIHFLWCIHFRVSSLQNCATLGCFSTDIRCWYAFCKLVFWLIGVKKRVYVIVIRSMRPWRLLKSLKSIKCHHSVVRKDLLASKIAT